MFHFQICYAGDGKSKFVKKMNFQKEFFSRTKRISKKGFLRYIGFRIGKVKIVDLKEYFSKDLKVNQLGFLRIFFQGSEGFLNKIFSSTRKGRNKDFKGYILQDQQRNNRRFRRIFFQEPESGQTWFAKNIFQGPKGFPNKIISKTKKGRNRDL